MPGLWVLHTSLSLPLILNTQGKSFVRNIEVTVPGFSRAAPDHMNLTWVEPWLATALSFSELWAAIAGSLLGLTSPEAL